MEYKKVSQLDAVAYVQGTDLMEVQHDNGDGSFTSYRISITEWLTTCAGYTLIRFDVPDGSGGMKTVEVLGKTI